MKTLQLFTGWSPPVELLQCREGDHHDGQTPERNGFTMKILIIFVVALLGMGSVGAQTNNPAVVKIPPPPQPPTNSEIRLVSGPLKSAVESATTPSAKTQLPKLTLKESEITRSRSGTEYRGILAGSPRPVGQPFNPLQLINPLAPMSYGFGGSSTASKPRIFRDERTHEPEGLVIINVTR